MNFRPELAARVMAGGKTVTRRLVSDNRRSPWWKGGCSLRVDKADGYAVCPGRGKDAIGRVRLVCPPTLMRLGRLHAAEAAREGFVCRQDFEDAFAGINGSYDPTALVWRIEFEVL